MRQSERAESGMNIRTVSTVEYTEMTLRRRLSRCRTATRRVAVALAAAVALVFTPCCELFAAVDQGAAGPADAHSVPGPDSGGPAHDHAPASGSWCATALDEIVGPLTDLVPPAANGDAAAWHTAHSYAPPLVGPLALHRSAGWLSRAGPALYLRFAHLLI
jgi:hypothetical protein